VSQPAGGKLPNVVVTGVAMTTPLATDVEGTWRALLEGRSGIREIDDPFVEKYDLPVRIGGHLLEDFDDQLTPDEAFRMSYVQRMATVLGRRARDSAALFDYDPTRLMVSIGTAMGAAPEIASTHESMRSGGPTAIPTLAMQLFAANGPSAAVALDLHAQAGAISPVSACASGSEGIAHAYRHLVMGDADVAVCGGVESKIDAVPIASMAQMQIVLSTNNADPAGASRPFDRDRDGFVFGEAGALMVIETEEHAVARGAPIMGRLMGAAITSDGFHMVAPDPDGRRAGDAMARAVRLAGLVPGDVDHVNAHATATKVGDIVESFAVNRAMGGHVPAVYAPKSALGHSVGAVGAVESILTLLAIRDGVIPPTLNLENLDPAVDLDVVAGSPRYGDYAYAVNNSFGFGGHNVALTFGRF